MKRVRRAGRLLVLHIIEALALVFAGLAIVCAVGLWRLSQGPLDLDFMREEAEQALAVALGGDDVTLGSVAATWSGDDRALAIVLSDVVVGDANGELITRAPRLQAGLDVASLAFGRVAFSSLLVVGGDISIVRAGDGSVAAGLGSPDHVLARARANAGPRRPGRSLSRRNFEGLRVALGASSSAASVLREVRVEDAVLHVRDEITGVDWRADQATLRITRDDDGVRAEARGVLATEGGPARLRLSARAGPSMRQVLLEAELTDAIPAFLFPSDGPLGILSHVQAPIRVTASAAVGETRGLLGADLDVSIGAGVVTVLGETHQVRSGQARVSYDPLSGALSIASAEIDAGILRGRFRGRLDAASDWLWGAGEGPYAIDLLGEDVVVDLRPTFRAPLDASRLELHGFLSPASATLELETLELDTRALHAAFVGQVRLERASDGRLLPAAQLEGPITGTGTVKDILDFWPVELADGAREWVEGLQSEDGGWAAFDADNNHMYLNHIPFSDHGALLDPPTADVTARVVGMLSQLGETRETSRALDRGVKIGRAHV